MPVEITNELSPEMQELADHRDHVRKMEAGVEYAKGELKTAKELLEAAQTSMNDAIDRAIEAARQPTLFSRFGDNLDDDPQPAAGPDGGGSGTGGNGTLVFDRIPAGPVEGVPGLFALPAEPKWRGYTLVGVGLSEAVSETAFGMLTAAGVTTCGELADQLVAGETFDLSPKDLFDVQHEIERLSALDATPLRFNSGDAAPGDAEQPNNATSPAASGVPTCDAFPADRSGKWEFLAAAFFHSHADGIPESKADVAAEYRRLKDQIADHRSILDVAGKLNPAWGNWSEFTITIRTAADVGVACEVLYKPNWHAVPGRDHFEFWAACLGPNGFWSCEENHPVKDGQVQYPAAYELNQRATLLAQGQADGFAKEQKKANRKTSKKGA